MDGSVLKVVDSVTSTLYIRIFIGNAGIRKVKAHRFVLRVNLKTVARLYVVKIHAALLVHGLVIFRIPLFLKNSGKQVVQLGNSRGLVASVKGTVVLHGKKLQVKAKAPAPDTVGSKNVQPVTLKLCSTVCRRTTLTLFQSADNFTLAQTVNLSGNIVGFSTDGKTVKLAAGILMLVVAVLLGKLLCLTLRLGLGKLPQRNFYLFL